MSPPLNTQKLTASSKQRTRSFYKGYEGGWTQPKLNGLKSCLRSSCYITTPHSTTGESPFRLTYGIEAVIPIELTELTWRTDANTDFPANTTNLREELEFADEVRSKAALRETTLKQKIDTRHSKKVIKREFEVGDLVLR